MRIPVRHEIHRFQNLKRSQLFRNNVAIEEVGLFALVDFDTPDEMRFCMDQGPQQVVQPSVKVLRKR